MEKERMALEAEESRNKGTPVTATSFAAWKAKFDKEASIRKEKELDEKLKALSGKEREEYKKVGGRLSGRQLFERDKNLATSDANLLEEGTVSVDIAQYDRTTTTTEDENDEDALSFSDSD